MFDRPMIDQRKAIVIAYDTLATAIAWTVSVTVGYSLSMNWAAVQALLSTLPVVLVIHVATFAGFRLYRGIWRYASFHDFRQIFAAVVVAALTLIATLFFWSRAELTPRSALMLNPLLLTLFMVGGRITYRWWKEHRPYARLRDQGKPVLILGAGDAGYKLVMQLSRSVAWAVVGLLDDNRSKVGRTVYGSPVLGRWDQLAQVATSTGARHAILSARGTDHQVRRRAFELCERAGIRLLVMPDIDDLIGGQIRVSSIREFQIEDLLRRDAVELDFTGLTRLLANETVLVTGAGGTIGAELCRQVVRFAPRRVVLFDSSEFALYTITEELTILAPDIEVLPYVGDIKDRVRLEEVFRRHVPDCVFHAAAYKHVPLMESANAWQAVRNNTLGTVRLMEAIARHPVRRMVFVSTDKAINPTSVMGATKRLSELLLQQWHRRVATQTVSVRFGNVLGSTGSVVPKFQQQIARGGPVTVTHPDIRRYFMSVPEAAQLVLQASLMGNGGEVFVLDMGEPVLIVDLARDLIRLSGLNEDEIPIVFSGLRPGEKLYEELLADSETTLPTRHPKVRISTANAAPGEVWEREVMDWLEAEGPRGDEEVRKGLARFIPEYTPYIEPAADAQAPGTASPAAVPPNVIPIGHASRSA